MAPRREYHEPRSTTTVRLPPPLRTELETHIPPGGSLNRILVQAAEEFAARRRQPQPGDEFTTLSTEAR